MAWASILNLQRMGLSRGRENVVYWCIPLFLLFTFSLVSFLIFLSFLLFFPCIPLFSILSCLPLASSFTIHGCPLYIVCHCGIYPFCPLTVLAPYGHPSRTTYQLASYPTITSAQNVLVAPLSISKQNYLSCFLPLSVLVLPIWIRIKLFHNLPLWHASSGLSQYLPLLGEMPSKQDISPKEAWVGTPE